MTRARATRYPREVTRRLVFLALLLVGCGGARIDPGFYGAIPEAPADGAAARGFTRPKLVVVRAEYCDVCDRVEPVLEQALEGYRDRIDIVVLDITDDESQRDALLAAEYEGVSPVLQASRGRTPTIGVSISPEQWVKPRGSMMTRRTYTRAFDEALALFDGSSGRSSPETPTEPE